MRIAILAVGRAKPGPELSLTEDYRTRFDAIGRGLGLGPLDIIEIDAKRSGREDDCARMMARIPKDYTIIALDERGSSMDSADFSTMLCDMRDDGAPGVAFLIGGADGHSGAVRRASRRLLSFGAATWPHMMVRAMLAEQVYRAAAIASNHPYHRGG